ncbi:TldD/PmbA family protein [Actinomycetospora sp. CA-084318]|uniref:TldD/PmbA family protein n=1 Tax=Actinomycetospora sp. CA-084318 TaxID=3239892 RepID=UPI003D9794CE
MDAPSDPRLVDLDVIAAALAAGQRGGGAWTEVFVEHRDSRTTRLDSGVVEVRTDRDLGAAVRVGRSGREGRASTTVLTREALTGAAQVAAGVLRHPPGSAPAELTEHAGAPVNSPRRGHGDGDTAERADLVRRVADGARVGKEIRSVSVTLVEVTQHVLVATTDGDVRRDTRVRTRVTCRVVARSADGTATGFEGPGIGGGLELFDDREPESVGAAAAAQAVRKLTSRAAPGGPLPVVLSAGGGGMLMHEACGHGLEADGVVRRTSVYAASQGHRVAGQHVTLVDDPTWAGGFGSYAIDDEGRPAAPGVLIDRGVQVAALTDRNHAALLGRPGTANGRRESAAHPPLCRMSNTYLAPGTATTSDVLGTVDRGVYITQLSGGEVDTTTGDFTFTAAEARLIERGELTDSLSGVTLLGSGPAALAGIGPIADDLSFAQAMCGNDGQWVPVSYGSPTMRIDGLTIAGTR